MSTGQEFRPVHAGGPRRSGQRTLPPPGSPAASEKGAGRRDMIPLSD